MNMLRTLQLLKNDLNIQNTDRNRVDVRSPIINCFSDYRGLPRCRMVQFYGAPDCGKTTVALDLIKRNNELSFMYISKNKDDIAKASKSSNAVIFMSNVFEDTISYLNRINRGDVDVVILDSFNNMLSKEELLSAFTKQLDNREILDKYIKKISLLAAQKNFIVIIFNGINGMTNKSRYGYIIEKESIANFRLERLMCSEEGISIKVTADKNLLSPVTGSKNIFIYFNRR